MRWTFDTATKEFTPDDGTIDTVGDDRAQDLRDDFIADQKAWADTLSTSLVSGSMSLRKWTSTMRSRVTTAYTALYALGNGGLDRVTSAADQRPLKGLIREQYRYLQKFAKDIKAGKLTPDQITQRAELYFESARQAFHEGRARSWEITLPAKPGDGSTQCLTNCKCRWSIVETRREIQAYWIVDETAEHCADCLERQSQWSPIVFPKSFLH